jgi:cob(I)alamin adenosyltransferase
MKIYTKTGDDGSTSLLGGPRVAKSDARIDCYGNVDELNACVGWAAVVTVTETGELLRVIQNDLFIVGSLLAVADGTTPPASVIPLEDGAIARLEMEIDAATAQVPPLRNFVLPGGSEASARLHIARTVCRRAERRLVEFSHDRPIAPIILTYLNRLSDWLFVYARLENKKNAIADVLWRGK